ncbi:MAG: hypothetical protein IPL84_10815 [Chitinophagaceae bacterium]|nr:hypothetical protein [Chitinophagaceae bacterium]
MKKLLLGVLLLATIASCKKSDDEISCEVSVAGIAGSYRITKIVLTITALPDQDITTTLLDPCGLSGVFQLKADKSVVYTETPACGGDGTGTWDVVSGNININHSGNGYDFPNAAASSAITGWDCSTLTLTESVGGGQSYKYTLTKQ